MLSKRLKCIADFVDCNSSIIDIGCDHGFLDIYLTLNKNCKCIASDISENVLVNTRKNIDKYNMNGKIDIVCSNGLNKINVKKNDIVIISGMGTSTIINILNNEKISKISNLIIQSNNDLCLLRKSCIKLGFYIYDEKMIVDHNKIYTIIYFKRGYQKYNNLDYLFGPIARKNRYYSNIYKIIYDKNKNILEQIPNNKFILHLRQYTYLYKIKKFTSMRFL